MVIIILVSDGEERERYLRGSYKVYDEICGLHDENVEKEAYAFLKDAGMLFKFEPPTVYQAVKDYVESQTGNNVEALGRVS